MAVDKLSKIVILLESSNFVVNTNINIVFLELKILFGSFSRKNFLPFIFAMSHGGEEYSNY